MDWNRAKFDRSNSTDFLDDARRRENDAAARWIKKEEGNRPDARKKTPGKSPKPVPKRKPVRPPADLESGFVIYTDGACEPNPGKGGWAFVVYKDGNEVHFDYGGDMTTTNNIMEMTGVMKALEWLLNNETGKFVRVLSDSQYVVKGCNEWRHNWRKRDWQRVSNKKTGELEPIKNRDLWRHLDGLVRLSNVKIEWVKGHVGIVGNERADELSNVGRSVVIAEGKVP